MPTLAGEPSGPTHAPPAMPAGDPAASASLVMATIVGETAPKHAPPSLPPARYRLGSEIARGGMGRVVAADDSVLGRTVAFKEALTTDADALKRFEREIRITARLEHPSIVPVHDAGSSANGAPFYVMRKVSGRPLERLVAEAATLQERLALLPHIVDSAQAVAHAHERGIVHRDIKPSNILVGDLGETVVIDWGLAKVIGEPEEQIGKPLVDLSDALKTRVGIVYGTPGFMAPEQLRGAPVHEGCDVYALGATLYHLLSRSPPHYAKTADEMMKAAVAAPPTPIRELVAGVPRDLSTIVDKALAHDPKVRYGNARALAEDLQRFLTGQLVASHHYSPREKVVRFVRKNRSVSAAAAAVVLIGAFAIVQIVRARNHADAARADAERRTEELTLARAREAIDLDPTRAVAMVKPLAATHWRDARAIGNAARARGVAWSYPIAGAVQSIAIGHGGKHALVASDGTLRMHDLAAHTTRTVGELGAPMIAELTDDERWIVAWQNKQLVIVDAASGAKRELAQPIAITALEVAAGTAYWLDEHHALWQLEVAAGQPVRMLTDEPITQLWPSPDGHWLALAGTEHLWIYDRSRPDQPPVNATSGAARQIGWAGDSSRFIVLIDRHGLKVADIMMTPDGPETQHNKPVAEPPPEFIGHRGDYAYGALFGQVWILPFDDDEQHSVIHTHVSGYAVGIANARGGALVIGATDGITVTARSGDHELPLQGANVLGIAASPSSPYVIARLDHQLLVWNLDDIAARQLAEHPDGRAVFASAEQVIVSGNDDAPPQTIDIASGDSHAFGDWPPLQSATASATGESIAVIDTAHHAHIIRRGQPALDLAGEVDIVGFAADQLAIAGLDGAISLDDLAHRQRTTLATRRAQLVALAWNRRQPWLAAAYLDGTLWRRQLASGAEATARREPPRDPAHPQLSYSQLSVGRDGSVIYFAGNAVKIWRADGSLGVLAQLPGIGKALATAGPDHLIAFTDDTLYTIELATGQVSHGTPARGITDAATSPETGLCVLLDHGQLDVIDTLAPPARRRWALAARGDLSFSEPAISADGRHVVARASRRDDSLLLMWTIDLPDGPDETVRWLNAMTNVGDQVLQPGG